MSSTAGIFSIVCISSTVSIFSTVGISSTVRVYSTVFLPGTIVLLVYLMYFLVHFQCISGKSQKAHNPQWFNSQPCSFVTTSHSYNKMELILYLLYEGYLSKKFTFYCIFEN